MSKSLPLAYLKNTTSLDNLTEALLTVVKTGWLMLRVIEFIY